MYIYIYIHIYIYIYVHVYIYVSVHVCIHVCIYTYIYIHVKSQASRVMRMRARERTRPYERYEKMPQTIERNAGGGSQICCNALQCVAVCVPRVAVCCSVSRTTEKGGGGGVIWAGHPLTREPTPEIDQKNKAWKKESQRRTTGVEQCVVVHCSVCNVTQELKMQWHKETHPWDTHYQFSKNTLLLKGWRRILGTERPVFALFGEFPTGEEK